LQKFNSSAKLIGGTSFSVAGLILGIAIEFNAKEVVLLMTVFYMIGIAAGPIIFYTFANPKERIFLVAGHVGLAFVKLSIKIFASDGNITQKDILKLKKYITTEFGTEIGQAAEEFAHKYKPASENLYNICAPLGEMSYSNRIGFVTQLFSMLTQQSTYSETEEQIIKKIAYYLHIGKKRFEMVEEMFISKSSTYKEYREKQFQYQQQNQNQSKKETFVNQFFTASYNPYLILGITGNSTIEEIKKAYRDLVKKYHPDKLSGKSESIINLSNSKFIEINEAYEKIKSIRGFK